MSKPKRREKGDHRCSLDSQFRVECLRVFGFKFAERESQPGAIDFGYVWATILTWNYQSHIKVVASLGAYRVGYSAG